MIFSAAPALPNVWALGLFTDRVQAQIPQPALDASVVVALWHLPFQPVWLSGLFLLNTSGQVELLYSKAIAEEVPSSLCDIQMAC